MQNKSFEKKNRELGLYASVEWQIPIFIHPLIGPLYITPLINPHRRLFRPVDGLTVNNRKSINEIIIRSQSLH
jgi:hypothetical protein